MHHKNDENSLTKILTNTDTNLSQTERLVSGIAGGGLIAYGLKRRDAAGAVLAVVGGLLGVRGATGHCHVKDAVNLNAKPRSENSRSPFNKSLLGGKVHVTESVTINKSPAELYAFWRNFENLPQFMTHLETVSTTDEKRSHWKAKAPLGTSVEWDAEVTSDVENNRIGWKSTEGADIPNAGVVEFLPTTNRGTEVKVVLTYEPPAGKFGALVAKMFGEEPKQQIHEDLRRFKRLMEAGLIMNVEGQTSGRAAKTKNATA